MVGHSVSESKSERRSAQHVEEKVDLKNEIAELKRKLAQTNAESEPTVDTAKPANCSYQDFVGDLEKARSQDAVALSAVIDEYRGKRVKWDCTILEIGPTDRYYVVGVSDKADPRNRAHAQFQPRHV